MQVSAVASMYGDVDTTSNSLQAMKAAWQHWNEAMYSKCYWGIWLPGDFILKGWCVWMCVGECVYCVYVH